MKPDYRRRSTRREQGLSLVEIMIALALGSFLTGGIFQVYSSSRQSYRLANELARMQENARFAMDMLTRDIRMAGFIPCRPSANLANALSNPAFYMDFSNSALIGYEGTKSEFPPALADASSALGTDAIVVLKGEGEAYSVARHQPDSATLGITGTHQFEPGEIALICDGKQTSIFQTTNNDEMNTTIVYSADTQKPGNCASELGSSGTVTCPAGPFVRHTYGNDAQLVRFDAAAYYIAKSVSGNTRSLYRKRLVIEDKKDASGNKQPTVAFRAAELLEGIENMQILYGLDTNDDAVADQYVTADQVDDPALPGEWNDVSGVRIGLLVHTIGSVAAEPDTVAYNVAGTVIKDTGTTVKHPADRRQRYVFTTTIKIRNRGLD